MRVLAQSMMLKLANDYDRLADRAEDGTMRDRTQTGSGLIEVEDSTRRIPRLLVPTKLYLVQRRSGP